MSINEPARRDTDGEPLIFAVKPRWDILRRLAPDETGWCAERSVDGVTHESIWLKAAMVFPRDPGDRVLSHIVRVEGADAILDRPYMSDQKLTRRDLGAIVVGSRQPAEWTPWASCWFSHKTYRFGRDDGELLASFDRYVRNAKREAAKLPGLYPESSLMGAEDRYRWKICDCDECTTGPAVAINH